MTAISSAFLSHFSPLQCISPGIVETEFAFRHHNSDPEKAAAVYESMKVRETRCVFQKMEKQPRYFSITYTSCLNFPVLESRRHSQCSHICPQCPSSCPGMSFFHPRFFGTFPRLICFLYWSPFVLVIRSEMCRWGQWSRCHSSGTGSCRRSRQQPRHGDSLATSAGQGRGEGDTTNQLQLFWICRDVVKGGLEP